MTTAHDLYYDEDRYRGRWFHPHDPARPEPDEPPMRRVGTCCHCGAGMYAFVVFTPDPYDPRAGDEREVVEPCDCDDLELHDDRPGGF